MTSVTTKPSSSTLPQLPSVDESYKTQKIVPARVIYIGRGFLSHIEQLFNTRKSPPISIEPPSNSIAYDRLFHFGLINLGRCLPIIDTLPETIESVLLRKLLERMIYLYQISQEIVDGRNQLRKS